MSHRTTRALKPQLDVAEERVLAAVHPLVGHLADRLIAPQVRHLGGGAPVVPRGSSRPVIVMFGGPGGQMGLPSNYQDWGAISIWNTTGRRLTFSVSASTYRGGQFFNFTLRAGQHQVYYAAYDSQGNAPWFRVSFDPISHSNATVVSDINTVFERMNWYPRVGTEGRPYAITTNVGSLSLTPI